VVPTLRISKTFRNSNKFYVLYPFSDSEREPLRMNRRCWVSLSARMGALARSAGLALVLISMFGCGPELSKQDLGTVVFEVPKVAGSDEPYPMPQLGPSLEQGGNTPGE